jgi:hypothetical protein
MGDTTTTTTTTTTSLQELEQLVAAEKRLSQLLQEVKPWLPDAKPHPHRQRVRPIPATMEQVNDILCLARQYACRTSAPAGWNPQAPVVGFGTPAPLPNQLRGGNLAALQLERAQADRKRQLEEMKQQVAQQKAKEAAAAAAAVAEVTSTRSSTDEPDPKRREILHKDKASSHQRHPPASAALRRQSSTGHAVVESMNLSDDDDDSSSDSEMEE